MRAANTTHVWLKLTPDTAKNKPDICPAYSYLSSTYFLQNAGVKRISTVNNSSRPIIIMKARSHLPTSGTMA